MNAMDPNPQGDVADTSERFERTMELFVAKFGLVFFVPGNHDLWVS